MEWGGGGWKRLLGGEEELGMGRREEGKDGEEAHSIHHLVITS